jgi:hypothetical protein
MNAPINERVTALPAFGKTRVTGRIELLPAQTRELLNVRRLPARLTVAQTAALLNCGEHDIPVLVSNGLLKPLGHPPPNAVKYFAPTEVLELAGDSEQMGQICDAVYEHWRGKNAAKSNGAHKRRSLGNGAAVLKRDRNGLVAH